MPHASLEQIPEWRRLVLDPATDRTIFRSQRTTNGVPAERGTDLLAHTAPSGNVYYYLWHWSKKPGETNIIQLTTEDSAQLFLREQDILHQGDENTSTRSETTSCSGTASEKAAR
jgi:hypothetical protein